MRPRQGKERAVPNPDPTVPQLPAVPLPAERLTRPADLSALVFETTEDLHPVGGLQGQPRARDALRLGTEIAARGFNIFAVGEGAARIRQAMRPMLEAAARNRPCPSDWVYVHNFATPYKPTAIRLPAARAPALRQAMRHLVDDLKAALPAAFESEDYQNRRSALDQEFRTSSEQGFIALSEQAAARGLVIVRTPAGFAIAPAKDGQVIPPEAFNALPEDQRRTIQAAITEMEKGLELTLRGLPRLEKTHRENVRALNEETARVAVAPLIEEAGEGFSDSPQVRDYLEAVRADLLETAPLFVGPHAAGEEAMAAAAARAQAFARYDVNVLVTQEGGSGCAAVIEELHPILGNLLGRIEYLAEQGALTTNFRLIKPGSLHRANGGIILIDARALLIEPFSWAALKRALIRQEIVIEDAARFLGMAATISLEPDPIPLDVKIVLFGDRMLYHMLAAADPEFADHVKVLADFDDSVAREASSEATLAGMLAEKIRARGLQALDRGGLSRIIEHAARRTGDQRKISVLLEDMLDLIAEAGWRATSAGRAIATREDVDTTIAEQARRAARIQESQREMILRDIALIETQGSRVGQINGLSVFQLGAHSFGSPTRITCRVRPGAGRIVDIEREVALGGALHSKGVLILSGFLAGRYAMDVPMSLSASLVFEQSYGGVDGDSASSAELYALLSALSGLPLRQDFAVTGSVNQHGMVQAIGGVNEKIEGYFDVCRARGLTGTQGVMIPASNAQHLMLRADVVAACAEGHFAIYPIETIDQGIALLTGAPAGMRGADGLYPEASVNRLVEDRLIAFARIRRDATHAESNGDTVERRT